MRVRSVLVVLSLLAFSATLVPGAEAAREPVGFCNPDAIVDICQVYCINPPCPMYICINTVERICTDG